MTSMTALVVCAFAMFVAMFIVSCRMFLGPSLYDRVLAVNSIGTKTVLFLALLNFIGGRPEFLDIAILYALINFVGTIAILKFFRYRSFSSSLSNVRGDVLPRQEKD